ncbi:hypothetical protein VNO78_22189 [Psophocarpus tetragonolobus]|uniref:Protein SLOW GREEN 1, chloroplastic n=1 Tax=Psophocarpus tetragonolobus TaxID=3891 RepID=A0AAN9SDC6_PSOTE
METLTKVHHCHLSLFHSPPPPPPPPPLKFPHSSFTSTFSPPFSPIRASASPSPLPLPLPLPSPSPSPKPQNPLTQVLQTLKPLVKPTCVAIAATAFFCMRLGCPALGAASETLPKESATVEQESEDAEALRSVLPGKIRAGEIGEAIGVLERLIELEPEELEYELLKAHLHMRDGEPELAENGFENLLNKDPLDVEAYRGLLMLISETNKPTQELLKRLEEVVKACERDSDVRDFKFLIAQVKVLDGHLSDALKVYEELVKDEPNDFRPYLCQGIVYTMLKMNDEAEKQFHKYRSLVPEDHPCNNFFQGNTKIFDTGLFDLGSKSSQ